ncbi:hypothetical protein LOZ65_006575 [Ophidiomyces ophidiicola]|nr:hypothetical protein LOZ65_006575 [Ophidiomyces ophidiicola]
MGKHEQPEVKLRYMSPANLSPPPRFPDSSGILGIIKNKSNEQRISGSTSRKEKRLLRSHHGLLKARSELSMYFPKYEQILSLEPIKEEFLSIRSKVVILDDLAGVGLTNSVLNGRHDALWRCNILEKIRNPLADLQQTRIFEGVTSLIVMEREKCDPLSPCIFSKAHKRVERKEKQLRNIEKERAQHEKIQLDRLLNALQGHDWLRVMGVGGIIESEKKLYEPKRAYFIMEVSTLLRKFEKWKDEEKKRKAEREHPVSNKNKDQFMGSRCDIVCERSLCAQDNTTYEESLNAMESSNRPGTSPGVDILDAWAARQLHLETMSALRTKRRKVEFKNNFPSGTSFEIAKRNDPPFTTATSPVLHKNSHLDNVLGTRLPSNLAFGQPIPKVLQSDFCLPLCILTNGAVRDCLRRKRRRKRGQVRLGLHAIVES